MAASLPTQGNPPFAGRWALVTGCSGGLGKALVASLRSRGWGVVATARSLEGLAGLPAGEDLRRVALDVTDPASIAGAVTACAGLPLAAVVNNAGYGQLAPLELLRPEELRAQFETNVIGLHAVTRAFLPLIRAGAGPGEGRIVQVASALGRISIPLLGAYNASKHAVVALAETLRLEIGREIPVILVEPGVIETGWRAVLVKTWGDLPRRAKGTSYEKVLQRYQEAGEGLAGEHGLSPAFCAEQIAAAMSRTRPPRRVVIGADSRWSQVAQSWTPAWIFEWALRRRYGIG